MSTGPDALPMMHQNWHHLLFLHWELPPNELQALLPRGLHLDTFEGKAYAGLVPFTISGVRPSFIPPLPLISSFHEVNVRTYVHRAGRDPGVWFFSLDASSVLAVAAARAMYKLPYFDSTITFGATHEPLPKVEFIGQRTDTRGARPADIRVHYEPADGVIHHATAGTFEHFLLERYVLYAGDEHHNLYRAQVSHEPYPIQRATVTKLEETLVWAAGIRRGSEAPFAHYAAEVNVKVYALERC